MPSTPLTVPLTPLALDILLALADGPRHGYGIIKDIEIRSGGRTSLRSGTLYTAIQRLRDDGLLEPCVPAPGQGDDARRKYFRMTRPGREAARQELERLTRVVRHGHERELLPKGPDPRSDR